MHDRIGDVAMTHGAVAHKLRGAGLTPTSIDGYNFSANTDTHSITWFKQQDMVSCLWVKRHGEEDDPQSDYYPGTHCQTIKKALFFAGIKEVTKLPGVVQMTAEAKVARFANKLSRDTLQHYVARFGTEHPDLAKHEAVVKVVAGKKYIKVDVGTSGKYMIVWATGEIFGIKAYGVIHRGHQYGTLDTINEWFWGGYTATKLQGGN